MILRQFLLLCLAGLIDSSGIKLYRLKFLPLKSRTVTVSGFSSGGIAAAQYYLSHSSYMEGLAIYSSMIYRCGNGPNVWFWDMWKCSSGGINLEEIHEMTRNYENMYYIDSLDNLRNQKIYIHHGVNDILINYVSALKNAEFFKMYSNHVHLKITESIHAIPTIQCGRNCTNKISLHTCAKCGFSGIYEGLNFIYGGNLINPFVSYTPSTTCVETEILEGLYHIDQSEFLIPFIQAAMSYIALVYIPPGCRVNPRQCNLHLAFHGCKESVHATSGMSFIRCSGYLEVANANNLIVLFPQTRFSITDIPSYAYCWDFNGYSGPHFGTNRGIQIQIIHRMVSRILGI